MSEVTQILQEIDEGNAQSAAELLPLVYDELRKLAAAKMAAERFDHTLQPTALVHEAYLRLTASNNGDRRWNGRGHFFGAAAKAMRRILIDNARRKAGVQHGGRRRREDLRLDELASQESPDFVLAIDDALNKLSRENEVVAQLVELRYFGGLTVDEAANALGVTDRTARRYWVYAKAWLMEELGATGDID